MNGCKYGANDFSSVQSLINKKENYRLDSNQVKLKFALKTNTIQDCDQAVVKVLRVWASLGESGCGTLLHDFLLKKKNLLKKKKDQIYLIYPLRGKSGLYSSNI